VETWEKLASGGDEESQVKVGEYYLKKADSGTEENRQKYGKLAVTWLIEASKQGNDRADELLKQCLQTKTGTYHTDRDLTRQI
jgi:TPR repeat protein